MGAIGFFSRVMGETFSQLMVALNPSSTLTRALKLKYKRAAMLKPTSCKDTKKHIMQLQPID